MLKQVPKRDIDLVYDQKTLNSPRKSMGRNSKRAKKGLEFGKSEYDIIDKYCKELNISWLHQHGTKIVWIFLIHIIQNTTK